MQRRPGLTAEAVSQTLRSAAAAADSSGDAALLAFTVMPDHIHWLFQLGTRLSLGHMLGRWKAATRTALASVGLAWQRDYFEHRLRPDEDREAYARYTYLNPYRAELIAPHEVWPHWFCPNPARFRFTEHLNPAGGIPPEWIADRVPDSRAVGE
jgi:REP element-mobilizing transposase RayT